MSTDRCRVAPEYTSAGSGGGPPGPPGPVGPQGPAGPPGAGGTIGYYGSFFDTADQTAVAPATAYPMRYNTTDFANGVSITNDGLGNPTQIVIANQGVYDIQFSAQLFNGAGGGSGETVDIWLRKNGLDVPDTATKVDVGTNEPYVVAAWNFLVNAAAGDIYQIMWATENTSIRIEHEVATAPHPAVPSVILTVAQITYTQVGPQGPPGPPGASTLQAAYTGGNSIVTAGGLPVAFNLTAGGFTVEGPGSIEVGVVTPISIFDVNAASTITLDSTGGAIGIGTDAVSQPINIGTGAAARTITLGNATGATGVVVNTGTFGLDVNALGPIALDGVTTAALNVSAGGTINVGTSGSGVVNVGTSTSFQTLNFGSGTASKTINIGTGTGTKGIFIGNTSGTTGVNIRSGNNSISIGTSAGSIGIGDSDGTTNILIGTSGAATKTITLGTTVASSSLTLQTGITAGPFTVNSGGVVDLNASGAVTIDSSGSTIGIGTDAVAQAINVGTGAAARKITIGNSTGATEVEVNTGTVGLDVNASGPIALDGVGASNLTASAGDLTVSTTTSGTLGLSSAGDLTFSDQYKSGSTYAGAFKFSAASAEYSTFETNFGEVSLLNAINQSKSAGRILQVVHASTTTTVTVSNTTAYTDTTLSATITPSSVTSKVLVFVSQMVFIDNATNAIAIPAIGALKIVRGSTDIWLPWETTGPIVAGSFVAMTAATVDNVQLFTPVSIMILDSPATTSATTYKTQGRAFGTNHTINIQPTGATRNGRSDIILMEVAG